MALGSAAPPTWRLRVEVDEPQAVVVVALTADGVGVEGTAGFASAGPAREAGAAGGWELYALGVEPALQGSGAADDLVRAVLGQRACVVWVLTGNARARSFYARHGFAADGSLRMHETLGASEVRLSRSGPP